jgi:teichuronic acid exporter
MLKQRLISSAKWNGVGKFFAMGSDFTLGVILARLLLPSDFGILAILTVFISLLSVFINSGFSQALVREKSVTEIDYSTVFYFNFIVATIVFTLSYLLAPYIASFYNNLSMKLYLRVLSITLFIDAFMIVQQSMLLREMNFKLISLISIFSSLISGLISIYLASNNYGIWSLILKSLIKDSTILFLTFYFVKWKPILVFSTMSFQKYFRYGVYMLGSSLIGQFYNNIFNLTIGKIFSPTLLGYYNRAELFKNTLSQNVDSIISGVSYPALSKLQDEPVEFLEYFKRILQFSFYIVSILMIGLMFNAKALICILLGEKWMGSIEILQYLCFIGLLFPINSITVNSISVTGRSKIYFKFQLFSIIGSLISLIGGYFYGLLFMIYGFMFISIVLLLWIVNIFNKLYDFNFIKLFFLLKNSFINIIILIILFQVVNSLFADYYIRIFLNFTFGFIAIFLIGNRLKSKEYEFIKSQLKIIFKYN